MARVHRPAGSRHGVLRTITRQRDPNVSVLGLRQSRERPRRADRSDLRPEQDRRVARGGSRRNADPSSAGCSQRRLHGDPRHGCGTAVHRDRATRAGDREGASHREGVSHRGIGAGRVRVLAQRPVPSPGPVPEVGRLSRMAGTRRNRTRASGPCTPRHAAPDVAGRDADAQRRTDAIGAIRFSRARSGDALVRRRDPREHRRVRPEVCGADASACRGGSIRDVRHGRPPRSVTAPGDGTRIHYLWINGPQPNHSAGCRHVP
jgi:hypothetical protein